MLEIIKLIKDLESNLHLSKADFLRLLKRYKKADGSFYSKTEIIEVYKKSAGTQGLAAFNQLLLDKLMMKPVRTFSGVAPVTVLTKPYPCPGKCIFCPNDLRMPKSYLADEPGAQRAEKNYFDPYLQTTNRLEALFAMGHAVDKVELIILGGTWTAYPQAYRIWFIKECFRAINEFSNPSEVKNLTEKYQNFQKKYLTNEKKLLNKAFLSTDQKYNAKYFDDLQKQPAIQKQSYNQLVRDYYLKPEQAVGVRAYQTATWQELEKEQLINETAKQRCVGLVIETRPDEISLDSVLEIRRLGATKVQLGLQSLDDEILRKNKRGHDVDTVRTAFALLRSAGFKLHIHFMANLYGGSVRKDKRDYRRLFADLDFRPDEVKIYPCSLIASAELMRYYKKGLWQPYSHQQLLDITTFTLTHTPEYCRITRMIRDIPSQDIVVGNTKSNFRQIAQDNANQQSLLMRDIRSREIRGGIFDIKQVKLRVKNYQTQIGGEKFIQFVFEDKILAFLRLSLPKNDTQFPFSKLKNAAMIREIHVYGRSLGIGASQDEAAQHFGFGRRLIERAAKIAKKHGYGKLAVISAIGTKEYYRKRGFSDGELYQFLSL
jgi:elongator complex protein 3